MEWTRVWRYFWYLNLVNISLIIKSYANSDTPQVVGLGNSFHPRLGARARIWRYFRYINIVDIFVDIFLSF